MGRVTAFRSPNLCTRTSSILYAAELVLDVRILEAFRTRNADTVEQIIHQHNRAALNAYTDYLKLPESSRESQLDRKQHPQGETPSYICLC